MGDPERGSSLPAAAWTPPWEWNAVSVRALMKVRGDSAHTLAKDAYVVDRAVAARQRGQRRGQGTS
ncbi:MAG: hypothetical protein ACRDYA_02285 [Egibacteraceae bacterium]